MSIIPTVVRSLDQSPERYQGAEPFPHIVIDNFLPPDVVREMIAVFPKPEDDYWNERIDDKYQFKLAGNEVDRAPAAIRDVLYQLNSASILRAPERLTGQERLIGDPYYFGGGLHQIEPGGHLSVHSDFTRPKHMDLYRRLNLLVYLNEDWHEEWGGRLELWSRDALQCVDTVLPVANRAVLFTTDETSYHGHPTPLACPPGQSRKSIALYYYTAEPPPGGHQGLVTRWRFGLEGQKELKPTPKQRLCRFLWRVSYRVAREASRLED